MTGRAQPPYYTCGIIPFSKIGGQLDHDIGAGVYRRVIGRLVSHFPDFKFWLLQPSPVYDDNNEVVDMAWTLIGGL